MLLSITLIFFIEKERAICFALSVYFGGFSTVAAEIFYIFIYNRNNELFLIGNREEFCGLILRHFIASFVVWVSCVPLYPNVRDFVPFDFFKEDFPKVRVESRGTVSLFPALASP